MSELLTMQDLTNGHLDVKSLGELANGDENKQVVTRTGQTYPSVKKALKVVQLKLAEANEQLQNNLDNADDKLEEANEQLKQAIKDLFVTGGLPATPFKTKAAMEASVSVLGDYGFVSDDEPHINGLYYKDSSGWVRSQYNLQQLIENKIDEIKKQASDDIASEVKSYLPPDKGLYADFVNNIYAIDGEECSFADIFELRRQSEAWLTTENGLKSFRPNEPRFQNGLVIEPEITNKITMESLLNGYNVGDFKTIRITGDFNAEVKIAYEPENDDATVTGTFISGAPDNAVLDNYVGAALRSITVRKGDSQFVSIDNGYGAVVMDTQSGELIYKNTRAVSFPRVTVIGQWVTLSFNTMAEPNIDSKYRIGFGSEYSANGLITTRKHDSLRITNAVFAELGYHSTHPILSINSATTKGVEKLICQKGVISIDGEWDDKLTVTHSSGSLLTEGSGVIKKLIINREGSFDWKKEAVAFWDFNESSAPYKTVYGVADFPLNDGGPETRTVPEGPFGHALEVGNQKYLIIPSEEVGGLNISEKSNEVTVVAWVKRGSNGANFIAGMWQEYNADPRRQYGLFIHLPLYDGSQGVCGHISKSGGPTPGYSYATEYSASLREVPLGVWQTIGFTYDGQQAISYLQGWADQKPNKNPLFFDGGLNNSSVSDFTVGAVKLSSGMGNFAVGLIGGVAIFNRALNSHEMMQIHMETLGKTNALWEAPLDNIRYPSLSLESVFNGKTYSSDTAKRTRTDVYLSSNFADFYYSFGYPIAATKVGDTRFLFTRGFDTPAFIETHKIGVLPTYDGLAVSMMRRIQAEFGNEYANIPVHFAVVVDGAWYVHDKGLYNKVALTSGADWSNSETLSVPTSGETWHPVTVKENTELSVGEELVSLPVNGHVEYVGLYTYRTRGHVRVRGLSVLST